MSLARRAVPSNPSRFALSQKGRTRRSRLPLVPGPLPAGLYLALGGSTSAISRRVGGSVARGSSHRAAGSSRASSTSDATTSHLADWMPDHGHLRGDPKPASDHSASPPVVRPDSGVRRTARIVGVLFHAGYFTYGVGSLIATGIVDSGDRGDSTALFVTGTALMLLNCAVVIGIGILLFPILRAHSKATAAGYLGTRIFEGVVLAIGVVTLIVLTSSDAIDANAAFYNVAEAGLGIGSLFFCALLFRTGLVPRWLAAWGFIGYACFAAGNLLALFGVAGAALVASIPGGLFELTFAIWLIARGFASTATVRSRAST